MACATWERRLTEPGSPVGGGSAPAPAHEPGPEPEPHHGFEDSRRLTGPNLYFAGTAVTLTPLGAAAANPAWFDRWAALVREVAAGLGWADPQPQARHHAHGTLLVFAAPEDALFTATELSEWAWECCLAEAGGPGNSGFDRAQDLGADPQAVRAVFAARTQAERDPRLVALRAAAQTHRLPIFDDDDEISLGAGAGSRTWPRTALPAPAEVPWADLHDVPTLLVTGSNGKTTTVRLLAAMARAAGLAPGLCSTEGVEVDGHAVLSGDYAGPAGARAVLRHPGVHAAVLETARGGLLRRGLAVRRADVAVVTNVSADHFGEYGIDALDSLAAVKLVVAHALPPAGLLVLNGADEALMRAAARMPQASAARQALFALDHHHPRLVAHRAISARSGAMSRARSGGMTCGVSDGLLLLHQQGVDHLLGAVADMPLALGGVAQHNIENLAAAALAARGVSWPLDAVRDTLAHFGARPQDNPGRLEQRGHRGAMVLIDYAHNPDGLAQLLRVARALVPGRPGRLGLLLGQAGNRDDAALAELARTAAGFAPDRVVIKELPQMLRGRAPGEVSARLRQGLLAAGLPASALQDEADEEAAALALLHWARPGDVIVLPVHQKAVRESLAAVIGSSAASATGVSSTAPGAAARV